MRTHKRIEIIVPDCLLDGFAELGPVRADDGMFGGAFLARNGWIAPLGCEIVVINPDFGATLILEGDIDTDPDWLLVGTATLQRTGRKKLNLVQIYFLTACEWPDVLWMRPLPAEAYVA